MGNVLEPGAAGPRSESASGRNLVLVAGAGPTGLTLALWLARLGVRVRLIDKTAEPGTTSRALVVHARTLEFYDQIGLADAVVEQGLPFAALNMWVRGRRVGRATLDEMGAGISPFPFVLIYPQDQHERFLIEELASAGVQVERPAELLGFEQRGDRVRARLRRSDGAEETCEAAYLAGCDGAHSAVREALGIGFPGGTYARIFYVADVSARGPVANEELHVALDESDLVGVFPLRGNGLLRLIGTIREDAESRQDSLGWDDVSGYAMQRLGLAVQRVNWFSTYRVHHRVAGRFHSGRTFLLGDAAHIHSPVGGQGMNTGIGDAVNLAWKLAAVLHGHADARILETYEAERIGFAQRLVATTDRLFTLATSDGPIARLVRVQAVPRLLPALFRLRAMRRFLFRTVSQTAVNYRGSQLSEGAAGRVHGGDRLPWVDLRHGGGTGGDNFGPLALLEWQVHVYGQPAPGLAEACASRGVPLQVFPWGATQQRAGLGRNAAYLVRPDGYVGLADADATPAALERYLDARGLQWAPREEARAHAA